MKQNTTAALVSVLIGVAGFSALMLHLSEIAACLIFCQILVLGMFTDNPVKLFIRAIFG